MAAEIAQAYVQIIPTAKGITDNLTTELSDQGKEAGSKAGSDTGESFGSSLSTALSNTGSALSNVGSAFTGVSVGVTAAATASVASWKTVDEAMDTVTTKTGATGEKLAGLQDSAKNIATTLPVSFQSAADAVGEVNTRFGLTGEECEELSTQFVQFAELNNTDVSTSIDNVQNALTAYGLSASDAGAMLDTLNQVGQNTGANVDTLATEMTKYGTTLQGLGLNAADSANLLGQLEMSGVDTATVLTGLSKVQQNAAQDGKSMSEELSLALQDSESAIDIFGTRAGPKLSDAFKNGQLNADMFTQSTHSLDDAVGSTSDTFTETQDPLDQMTVALNNLAGLGASLVDAAAPLITSVSEALIPAIQKLTDLWNGLSPTAQETIVKIGLIVAAIGPLLSAVGSAMSAIGALGPAVSALSGPFGIAVVAIGGAVAAGVAICKNWDTIKAKAGELKDKISEKFNGIKDKISGAWDTVKQKTSDTWTNMKNTVDQNGGGIKGLVKTVSDNVSENWKNAFDKMNEDTNGKLGEMKTAVGEKIPAMQEIFDAFDSGGILGVFGEIRDGITDKIETARDKVGEAIDKIKGFFDFEWHLPSLKLPHFSISGKFSLDPPSVPHFSVDWYAKAMSQPYMLQNATLFGAGEAGDEVIYGHAQLMSDIRDAVSDKDTADNITINVYQQPGQSNEELVNVIERRIAERSKRRGAVFA